MIERKILVKVLIYLCKHFGLVYMKKYILLMILVVSILSMGIFAFSSCGQKEDVLNKNPSNSLTENTQNKEVTVVDFDGNSVLVKQNPKKVAIYDYAILDILNNIGFEKTGIQTLIVPSKETMPRDLLYFKNQNDDVVINGGTLFYVDWDILDLVEPELVILGHRAFGMNADEERLNEEDTAKFRSNTEERYQKTSFVKLTLNEHESDFLADVENNVNVLAAIFPEIADELKEKLQDYKTQISEINKLAEKSDKKALFAMMQDQTTLAVFNPGSRFSMLYEEFGFTPASKESVEWTDNHGFNVRAEYVLEVDPDIIFVLDRSAAIGTGAGVNNFLNDPIIAKTKAAKNNEIYMLSSEAWYLVTGGYTSIEHMISDIKQCFE